MATTIAPQRHIIIGDIHGCVDELKLLLDKVSASEDDVIISVGDLVAKGPDSEGVIQVCRERGVIAVRGNHDDKVIKYSETPPDPETTPFYSKEHEELAQNLSPEALDYLKAMPLYYRLPADPKVVIIHAGLLPETSPADMDPFQLMNMRCIKDDGTPTPGARAGTAWTDLWTGPDFVIFGHDATRGLQQTEHAVGLDTGCCYGGALTAYLWPEGSLVSVKAKKVYSEPVAPPGMKDPPVLTVSEDGTTKK